MPCLRTRQEKNWPKGTLSRASLEKFSSARTHLKPLELLQSNRDSIQKVREASFVGRGQKTKDEA